MILLNCAPEPTGRPEKDLLLGGQELPLDGGVAGKEEVVPPGAAEAEVDLDPRVGLGGGGGQLPAPARVPEGPDVLEVDCGDGDLDLLERELLRLGEHVAVEGDEGGAVEVGPLAVAAPGVRLDCDIGKLLLARGLYRVVSNPQER